MIKSNCTSQRTVHKRTAQITYLEHGLPHELGVELPHSNLFSLHRLSYLGGILDISTVELLDCRYNLGHGECLSEGRGCWRCCSSVSIPWSNSERHEPYLVKNSQAFTKPGSRKVPGPDGQLLHVGVGGSPLSDAEPLAVGHAPDKPQTNSTSST